MSELRPAIEHELAWLGPDRDQAVEGVLRVIEESQ